ncbi:MAG TPA: type II toxin-antitoxin system RelE/ParE family toxin [Candidatus Tectomicrobia bacterium]|nr:type II toxin-antitoxin system RelE/ParE family toxin [Candidatus Tectomicrobia bacterium]
MTADQEAWPASWLSMILHHRDRRSHVSDGEPALSLDCIGWVEASMSPFDLDGDLAGTPVSFPPSVRSHLPHSQVGRSMFSRAYTYLLYSTHGMVSPIYGCVRGLVGQPALRFPYSSSVVSSRHAHMREFRGQHAGRPYRIPYAFDPRRTAILLIGGDKTGDVGDTRPTSPGGPAVQRASGPAQVGR